jgi:hypothetical protein
MTRKSQGPGLLFVDVASHRFDRQRREPTPTKWLPTELMVCPRSPDPRFTSQVHALPFISLIDHVMKSDDESRFSSLTMNPSSFLIIHLHRSTQSKLSLSDLEIQRSTTTAQPSAYSLLLPLHDFLHKVRKPTNLRDHTNNTHKIQEMEGMLSSLKQSINMLCSCLPLQQCGRSA